MHIKLTEEQKERLIQNMNRIKEVTNEVKDNAPITYENMINLTFVEYFFADLFNLQLPKYKDCQHEDTCRSYYLLSSKFLEEVGEKDTFEVYNDEDTLVANDINTALELLEENGYTIFSPAKEVKKDEIQD